MDEFLDLGDYQLPSGIFGRVTNWNDPVVGYQVQLCQGSLTNPLRVWSCETGDGGWFFISLGDEEDVYYLRGSETKVFYPGLGNIIQLDYDFEY
jgi:hypothetical protein